MAHWPYKTVALMPEARIALDSLTATLCGRAGRMLTISEAVVEANQIIRNEATNKSGDAALTSRSDDAAA